MQRERAGGRRRDVHIVDPGRYMLFDAEVRAVAAVVAPRQHAVGTVAQLAHCVRRPCAADAQPGCLRDFDPKGVRLLRGRDSAGGPHAQGQERRCAGRVAMVVALPSDARRHLVVANVEVARHLDVVDAAVQCAHDAEVRLRARVIVLGKDVAAAVVECP